MKTATLLKKKFSKKQLIIIGIVAAIPVLVGLLWGGFLLLQQSAISSRASEEAPSNIVIEPTEESVKVKWNSGVETSPIIQYGTTPDAAGFDKTAVSPSGTNHEVDLSSLDPGTYYFKSKLVKMFTTIMDYSGHLLYLEMNLK